MEGTRLALGLILERMMTRLVGLVHADPKKSEIEAVLKIAPHLKNMKREIMILAIKNGDRGIIPDEVPGLINTIRRRITDLWKEGFLKPSGMFRKNKSGNNETVWIPGRDEKAFEIRETKGQIIKRLENRVKELEDELESLHAQRELFDK